jgi:hypothetical protein
VATASAPVRRCARCGSGPPRQAGCLPGCGRQRSGGCRRRPPLFGPAAVPPASRAPEAVPALGRRHGIVALPRANTGEHLEPRRPPADPRG